MALAVFLVEAAGAGGFAGLGGAAWFGHLGGFFNQGFEAQNSIGAIFFKAPVTLGLDHDNTLGGDAAIGQFEHFPPIVSQMLAVGEETGKVDEVMFNLSGYFETEAEQAVKGLTTAIEPLMMILLGVGVAFLVIAIILPIYNLTSQF